MSVNYKPFFKLLIDKEIQTTQLVKEGILSRSTMLKIKKGGYVSLEVLEELCKYLSCTLNDMVEFTSEPDVDNKKLMINKQ